MSLTLGRNIASLQGQRRLFDTEQRLASVFERLSSGQRINRASDDAAGLAIASDLNADQRVFGQAIRNVNDGVSALNIADSTVAELTDVVTRIRELAQQAANGSLSNQQRDALDNEAQELSKEFFRVSRGAEFNGLRLFDGSIESGLRLQAGYGVDGSIQSSLGGALGSGTYDSAVSSSFTAGATATGITGDFNGDGIVDVINVGNGVTDISVGLGQGDGTFSEGQIIDLTTSVNFTISTGDLNNDGVLDLFASGLPNSYTFLGNGDGTFQDAVTVQTGQAGNTASESALADFNNDGFQDLVTTRNGATYIASGLGDGTFATAEAITSDVDSGGAIRVADFNNDGIVDLALTGQDASLNGILEVQFGSGDGTFSSTTTVNIGAGVSADYFDYGDLDGDGDLDFAIDNSTAGSSFTVVSNQGAGQFTEETISGMTLWGGGLSAMAVGDSNGDGFDDIAIADSNGKYVFTSNGNASSFQESFFQSGRLSTIDFADLDGDTVNDLIGVNLGAAYTALAETREGLNPLLEFSLQTQADALQAIAPLENKIASLTAQRGAIGAFQSRLTSSLNTLGSTKENYAAAEGRIVNADVALEAGELTRLGILRQAAASVLAQANQQPAVSLLLLSDPS